MYCGQRSLLRLGNLLGGGCARWRRVGHECSKQVTLPCKRLTLFLGRLRLCYFGELTLRLLTWCIALWLGGHVVQVAQERCEIQLLIQGPQLIIVGRTYLQLLGI